MDEIPEYKKIIKEADKIEGIKGVFPLIRNQALITDSINTTGTLLYGIDPALERKKGNWDKYIKKGNRSDVLLPCIKFLC